jgi:hypothetical protein
MAKTANSANSANSANIFVITPLALLEQRPAVEETFQ